MLTYKLSRNWCAAEIAAGKWLSALYLDEGAFFRPEMGGFRAKMPIFWPKKTAKMRWFYLPKGNEE
jgi:hypothetical protein